MEDHLDRRKGFISVLSIYGEYWLGIGWHAFTEGLRFAFPGDLLRCSLDMIRRRFTLGTVSATGIWWLPSIARIFGVWAFQDRNRIPRFQDVSGYLRFA